MQNDPELSAMSELIEILEEMDIKQVKRILDWASSRFGVSELMAKQDEEAVAFGFVPVKNQFASSPQIQASPFPPVVHTIQTIPVVPSAPPVPTPQESPVSSEEDTTEETDELIEAEEMVQPDEEPETSEAIEKFDPDKAPSTKGLGFKRFKNIENLFLGANIKSIGSKILLAAAYIQEKEGFDEMSSYDINSRLKKLGYGVGNITTALNTLLKKHPPLMKQTKKEGTSKQAKRKFVITADGLELAKTYLKSANE